MLLLVLAACGGDGESGGEAEGEETAPPAEAEETEPAEETEAAPTEEETEDAGPTEVTAIDWAIATAQRNSSYSMLAVAEHMGYFADEGLEVTVHPLAGAADVIAGIVGGELDFGSAPPEGPLAAIVNEGAELQFVYNIIRAPTMQFAVLADGPIKDWPDFKGTKLGAASLGVGNIHLANGSLRLAGLNPDEDVEYLAVGVGAQAWEHLRRGDVDGLVLFDAQYVAMEALGAELRYFAHPDAQNLVSTQVIAPPDYIEENPDVIAGFGRALAKATLFVKTNPEAAVRIMWEVWPETFQAGVPEEEQLETALAIQNRRMELILYGNPGEDVPWGSWQEGTWEQWAEFAEESGIINEPVDPESLYTDQFIEQYNDFDPQEVIDAAENWSG